MIRGKFNKKFVFIARRIQYLQTKESTFNVSGRIMKVKLFLKGKSLNTKVKPDLTISTLKS